MRLFIGVWLSEKMKDEVERYIRIAREQSQAFKWSAPEQLHFTLKFLGETPEKEINRLNDPLQSVVAGFTPFELRLGKPGRFPERGNPRVLWIGTITGEKELQKLAETVEAACVESGFPAADRPFKPHLTIGRAKEGQSGSGVPDPKVAWQSVTLVEGFSLIESKLQPGGAVYRRVRDFRFR